MNAVGKYRSRSNSGFKKDLYSKIKRGELIYAAETYGNGVFLPSEQFQTEKDRSELSEKYMRAFGVSKPEVEDSKHETTKSALSDALRGLYGKTRKENSRPAVNDAKPMTPREYVSESPAPSRKSRKTPFVSSTSKLKLLKTKMLRKTRSHTMNKRRDPTPSRRTTSSQSSRVVARPKSRPPPPSTAPPQQRRYRVREETRSTTRRRSSNPSSSGNTNECLRREGCTCPMCAGGGESFVQIELRKCPHCERSFNPSSFAKHVKSCVKVFQKQRKRFDMASKRVRALAAENRVSNPNELIRNVRKGRRKKSTTSQRILKKQSKWHAQSSQLREAMRAARSYKAEKKRGVVSSYTPSAPDPSLKPCPYCSRTFNATAFERHVKHCKNAKSKPKRLRKGGGISAGSRQARMGSSKKGGMRRRRW